VYATYAGGIESIARCSEILGPIVILMLIFTLLASANNVDLKYLLPVYADSGLKGIIKGSLAPASYLGHSVEYLMLAAFLHKPRQGAPYAFGAIITATLVVLISMTTATAVLGVNLAPKMWYPFFEMSRKISMFGFIENLDPLPIVIWVASVFIKLAIYMFVTSYGTAQFLQIQNWRIMIWFVAPVVLLFAMIPGNVSEATAAYLLNYWVPIALPVNMIGLPLLLLIVGKIKQARRKPEGAPEGDPPSGDNGQQTANVQMEGTRSPETQAEDSEAGNTAAGAPQVKGRQASDGQAETAPNGEPAADKPPTGSAPLGGSQAGDAPEGASADGSTQAGRPRSGGTQADASADGSAQAGRSQSGGTPADASAAGSAQPGGGQSGGSHAGDTQSAKPPSSGSQGGKTP
jgi:hypothetical protein